MFNPPWERVKLLRESFFQGKIMLQSMIKWVYAELKEFGLIILMECHFAVINVRICYLLALDIMYIPNFCGN